MYVRLIGYGNQLMGYRIQGTQDIKALSSGRGFDEQSGKAPEIP